VDCVVAFALAASWLEDCPQDPDAAELAALSLECRQESQPEMAEVALHLLATADFRPALRKSRGGWHGIGKVG
jgi:hypothetical protein